MNAIMKIGVSTLLVASAASVIAAPGLAPELNQPDGERGYRNLAQKADIQIERGVGPDRFSGRSDGQEWQGKANPRENQINLPAEQSRRPARMSVEERRALRRQINEAGIDLYLSKP